MKGLNEIKIAVNDYFKEYYENDNKFNHSFFVKKWEKNNKIRAYINRTNGRNSKTVGWVDLETLELNDFSDWRLEEKVREILK